MWFEECRRRFDIEVQIAVFARAMGNDIPIPDPDKFRRRFDELLAEDPGGSAELPTERTEILREAFGTNVR